MNEQPKRVVAVDQMNSATFALHIKWRHPGLVLPGHRYRHRFESKRREAEARRLHAEAHRRQPHAHVHVSVVVPKLSPDAELIGDVTGVRRAGLS